MTPFAQYLKLSAVTIIALSNGVQAAPAAPAPQHVDVKQLSRRVEDVVVPLPNEVFGALNKLGSVNWHEYVRTDKGSNFTERPRIALLLGTVIADGFIAVQAEDAPAVKDIGQRVQALARGIGVERSITQHAKAIIEAADKRRWDNVRQELDRTQNSVQQAMNEVHDEKLSQLVSLPSCSINPICSSTSRTDCRACRSTRCRSSRIFSKLWSKCDRSSTWAMKKFPRHPLSASTRSRPGWARLS